MVRVITQETFDNVVKENIEEFEMSREEAIKEAIEQFEAQGVDLSNIVISSTSDKHAIVEAVETLQKLLSSVDSQVIQKSPIIELCNTISGECKKGLAEKMLATKEGSYDVLVQAACFGYDDVVCSAVEALANLLDGNPDPLDERGFTVIVKTLETRNTSLRVQSLNLALNCCVRHEQNRQNLVRNGLLDKLDHLVDDHPVEVARVWQALVQDDDVRVPFGKAHDHAREIVEEHHALERLTQSIKNGDLESQDLVLLLSCLSSLCVRNEYCQAVVDCGALSTIFVLLMNPDQKREVVRACLKLLKVLAGNDNVKKDIAVSHGIETIINSLNKHQTNESIASTGCSALTALCLRNPENSKQVVDAGGANLLIQILKIHHGNGKVLTSCASAIRNIVSRARDLSKEFIDLDVEPLLNQALVDHPSSSDDVRAALRDLGLKVNLKEEWKGEKIKIKSDFQPTFD